MSSAAYSTQHSTTCAPVFRWALLVACMALLPLPPAIAELEEICSDIAEAFLEELAAEGPAISSAGCSAPGADDFVVCGAEGSVGTCSDVFGCSTLSTIMLDACSEPGAVEACCVAFSGKPCSTCTETTQSCLQACVTPGDDYSPPLSDSDDYSPPLTASEPPDTTPPSSSDLTDSECADFGEEVLEALAEELDDFTTCSSAGTGEFCDVLGSAGTCGSNPACDDVTVTLTDTCTSTADDSVCCTIFLAKPCSTCDPEPVTCSQVCISGDSSSPPPVAPPPVDPAPIATTPTSPVTFDPPPPTAAVAPAGDYEDEVTVLPAEAVAEAPDDDLTIIGGVPSSASMPDNGPPPAAPPPLDSDPEDPAADPEVPVLESGPPLDDVVARSAAVTLAGRAGHMCGTALTTTVVLCALL